MNTNRLGKSHSPYLLQHASNPVHWYPWGEEAFLAARELDKPLFLSIGYATCHWCHVMAHESFEDPEIADVLNEAFVCVKVDREERPDIDALYMAACQLISGSGGWPLSIFMTHERLPFFAATYIPKTSRFGRLGIVDLTKQIQTLWRSDRQRLIKAAQTMKTHIESLFAVPLPESYAPEIADRAVDQLVQRFDPVYGGFEPAPKFPNPYRITFLLHQSDGRNDLLPIVRKTLTAMRHGGIWDHVGFGFHRYSTDRKWLVPHFEKMLTDQALMATAYLHAYEKTGDALFERTAREILAYVLRDLKSPEGAFYSAEDADSEGEEGRFYTWSFASFQEVLEKDAQQWAAILDVRPEGNFFDEATGRPTGTNILYWRRPLEQWAAALSQPEEDLHREWESVRKRLLERRSSLRRPLRDEKILLDGNGMMIQALANAAVVLNDSSYAEHAVSAAEWLSRHLVDGAACHRWFHGDRDVPAMGNDYAHWIGALLALYRATGSSDHLAAALKATEMMEDLFFEDRIGLFHTVSRDIRELPVRPLHMEDGAVASPQSVMLNNYAALHAFTRNPLWKKKAETLSESLAGLMRRYPLSLLYALEGISHAFGRE
ncbi:MAG: thioredoxin domain-containing protein [Thermodesulfobacteriota bacterium]